MNSEIKNLTIDYIVSLSQLSLFSSCLRKQQSLLQWFQDVASVICDWWISTIFVSFVLGALVIIVTYMNDSCVKYIQDFNFRF